ncbi:MAG: O-antigen ligase family protein [Candidatus Acidiferrum sp.]
MPRTFSCEGSPDFDEVRRLIFQMSEIVSTAWWQSKLARRFDYVAVVVAIAVVGRLAFEEDLSWVVGVIVGITVVLLTLTRWPFGALTVLIGMSAMPVFFVDVFGWKARPEHFAALIVSIALCQWLLRHKRRVNLEKMDYWVLAYVAINYISSVLGSSEPSATLRWALQNNLAVLPYFLIRLLVRDLETLRKAFQILLAAGIVACLYGILCYASYYVFGTTAGMQVGLYLVDVSAPYGSMTEANLFGAYAGCCAVLFLALFLGEQRRIVSLAGFLLASLAAVLSFSRAANLALVVAIGFVFWKSRHARTNETRKLTTRKLTALMLPATLILVVTASAFSGVLRERFSSLFSQGLADETTITRLVEIQEALQDISGHPVLGSGTASFQLSFDWGKYIPDWANKATWVGNITIRVLHDTGVLGLATLLGFFISVWFKVRRSLRFDSTQVSMLLGLSAGALLYGISFQATDGTILAFPWVHFGFLTTAASLVNSAKENVAGPGVAEQKSI